MHTPPPSRLPRRPLGRTLAACAVAAAAVSTAAWAAAPAARPVVSPAVGTAAPAAGTPAPAAAPSTEVRPPLPLEDKAYERPSAGISIRAPRGWANIVEADRDEIARFVDDPKKQDWNIVVTRQTFPEPQELMGAKDARGEFVPGVVERTLSSLKLELPGAKVLRAGDPTTVGAHDVGVIVLRYTKNGERRLAQYAIVKANDQLYYMVRLSSPARRDVTEDANEEEKTVDPGERQAMDTFRNVVDSVKLLDLGVVRKDQTERLYRTRGLLTNLTERRLTEALVPERYLRIVRAGQDVGYSYVVEAVGRVAGVGAQDNRLRIAGPADGFTVGIRTRLMTGKPTEVPGVAGAQIPKFPREDSEAWFFCAMDRRNEDWSKIAVFDDGKPKTADNPWRKVSEVGSSKYRVRRVAVIKADPDLRRPEDQYKKGENGDPKQPWTENRESYDLTVQFKATRGDLPAVNNPLPPFYLPQGLGAILPRVVPATEPKTYMFASYVSEMRQVMSRYVDVRREEPLPAELVRARPPAAEGAPPVLRGIPIDDKLGYEGDVTTHWVTAKGEYLGSVTPSTRTVVVPTDEATLKRIWGVADGGNLRDLPAGSVRPDEVNRGGAGSGKPGGVGSVGGDNAASGGHVGNALVNPIGPGR